MIGSLFGALVGINLLAYVMVRLRPRIYHTQLYRPMLTNIKLSILPLGILLAMVVIFSLAQVLGTIFGSNAILWWIDLLTMVIGVFIWVLLLPNSGYLVTELNFNHRDGDAAEVPLWYDIISVLTLAVSGVMNMCFNVLLIQFMVAILTLDLASTVSFLFEGISWAIMALLMTLASFGIYLGRYLRFNSWDIKRPASFIDKLRTHFKEKGNSKNCLLFVVFHSLFFIVFYNATVGVVLQEILTTFA